MREEETEAGTVGSSFEAFLHEQGVHEETTAQAIKRVIAFEIAQAMKEQRISKVVMAERLETSRSQLDRLLDPEHEGVTLGTLTRAAHVLGRQLSIELR